MTPAVELRDVTSVAALAEEIVAQLVAATAPALPSAEFHHIGATALGAGSTKGDVDVNVRVQPAEFDTATHVLSERHDVAQPENWTPTFASFAAQGYPLPLGIQLTAIGSDDDFLLALRDRMRNDPDLLLRYDEVKRAAAPAGADAYWEAKNAFLRSLLGRP